MTVVDSTYRWLFVIVLAVALTIALLSNSRNERVPARLLKFGIGGGVALALSGLLLAVVFNEPLVDALLLRSWFGFPVPDTGIHGYGWGLIFGYSLILASVTAFVVNYILNKKIRGRD